ncbi:MAG TPA: hypothetical protein VGE52_00400, partial [Pirellulales bacterium]
PAKLTPGLQVASGDQRIDVLDTFSADWFKKLALPAGAEFTLDGWFEAADDGPMQWQISSNLAVAIEVDGRPLGGPSGEGWTLIPFRAAAGQHHLKISGKTLADANVEPRLSVRLGDRGTSSLDEKRFSHAN